MSAVYHDDSKLLRNIQTRDPFPGNRVYLTLKKDLQLAAEAAFGDQAGAAVMLDVHTGEVLAMVSRPSFNPAAFASGITAEEWIHLLNRITSYNVCYTKLLRKREESGDKASSIQIILPW